MSSEFSVLMSIYINTTFPELDRCLESIYRQSKQPDEIVIVKDGPLLPEVSDYLEKLTDDRFNFVTIEKNRGLGIALAKGLEASKNELVARMDSDDYCINDNRFEKQCDLFAVNSNLSVCGGGLVERYVFGKTEYSVARKLPNRHCEIACYAKSRNPINHQTVMYRKKHVQDSGGYQSMQFFEDYYLWARMLLMGHTFENIPENLVKTEVDEKYFERRGGIAYMRNEIDLATTLYKINFFNTKNLIVFLLKRFPIRILPTTIRRMIYLHILRNHTTNND